MNTIAGLLGPEGVEQRMSEIQRKLDAVFGPSFVSYLPGAPKALSGKIGGASPFNPLSGGAQITPTATPEIRAMISDAARQAGVDQDLFDSLIAVESGYDPNARSKAGAMGLAQLMPATAAQYGATNPFDPQQNLLAGAKYYADLFKQFGTKELALAAYNSGPGAVIKAGNAIPPYPETQNYVNKIINLFNARKSQ